MGREENIRGCGDPDISELFHGSLLCMFACGVCVCVCVSSCVCVSILSVAQRGDMLCNIVACCSVDVAHICLTI